MKRTDIIKELLAGRNEKLLQFLFKEPLRLVNDQNGTMDLEHIEANIGALSGGEQIMCRVAMDIWGEYGNAKIFDICRRLDSDNFERAIKALIQFRSI